MGTDKEKYALDSEKAQAKRPELSLSKKSTNGWAFLRLYDKMVLGDERCWNAEKWIVVS